MAYSGDPKSSNKDYVRFITGDIFADEIMSDTEIEFIIEQNGDNKEASVVPTMRMMLPRVMKLANSEKVGDVSIDYGEWYDRLKDFIDEEIVLSAPTGIYVGGMVQTQVDQVKNANTGGKFFTQSFDE